MSVRFIFAPSFQLPGSFQSEKRLNPFCPVSSGRLTCGVAGRAIQELCNAGIRWYVLVGNQALGLAQTIAHTSEFRPKTGQSRVRKHPVDWVDPSRDHAPFICANIPTRGDHLRRRMTATRQAPHIGTNGLSPSIIRSAARASVVRALRVTGRPTLSTWARCPSHPSYQS